MHSGKRYPYSLLSGLSSTTIAIIVAVIVIVVVAGALAVVLTRKPSVVTVTTTIPTTVTTTTTVPTTTTTTTVPTIVFYTWWATTGKIALNHLTPAFESATGITVEPYIVPGAGGTNAKYAILALIEAGKPPTTFQVHYGPEMISYVEAAPQGVHSFVNMTPYSIQWGLMNNAVYAVLQSGAFNGTLLSIPVNVHRGALLYVNVKVLREYGLPFPTNFSTLVYDTMYLVEHGFKYPWMVPGADGGWDQLNLWEDIFLSLSNNATLYNEMVYGTINFNNPTVENLINETNYWFLNFTSYDYPGWQSMTWTQGLTLLVQGKVVFQANGNWLTNYAYDFLNTTAYPPLPQYISNSSVTLIESPFPGTQNFYALVIDSIGIPVSPYQQYGLKFAQFWSSYQGQEVWTKWKAVTYYKNGTDWYNTPAQWYDYQQLTSTSEQDFVYQLSDGGLFDDVFAQLNSGLLTLQQAGSAGLSTWNSTLVSAMHEEESEWLAAAKLGLGYLGFPGHPFANYYPPWVTDPSAFGLDPVNHYNNSSAIINPIWFALTALAIPITFWKKIYPIK